MAACAALYCWLTLIAGATATGTSLSWDGRSAQALLGCALFVVDRYGRDMRFPLCIRHTGRKRTCENLTVATDGHPLLIVQKRRNDLTLRLWFGSHGASLNE